MYGVLQFFFSRVSIFRRQISLFIYCLRTAHGTHNHFIKKSIKNRSYDTIHIFKNYFTTVFSFFSFQQNKLYLNGPKYFSCVSTYHIVSHWQKVKLYFLRTMSIKFFELDYSLGAHSLLVPCTLGLQYFYLFIFYLEILNTKSDKQLAWCIYNEGSYAKKVFIYINLY